MLYIPKNGHMWDTSIVHYEDKYYMFSMFNYFGKECVNVWCAVSEDGVHFRDVGTVISDQPSPVWKMFVHRYGSRFVMNYGSFSNREGHGNDTLRFWVSEDLIHWEYCGSERDAHPDPRWYREEQRFDHMYTLDDNGKFYGYVVATPKAGGSARGCGLMESFDGIAWTALPPPVIEWGDVSPTNFEVGGCEKINGRYYLIGGTAPCFGSYGYSVFTFVADSPLGPFRPCLPRFRLCGNSHGKYSMGKQWLASFGRGKNGEVLITNYLTAPGSSTFNFVGTKEKVWFLPIKKAIIGSDNELAMGYWEQNDLLKAKEIPIDFSSVLPENKCAVVEGNTIYLKTADYSHEPFTSLKKLGEESNFVFLKPSFDVENGVVVEGNFQISHNGKLSKAIWGILLGEMKDATLISLEAGDRRTTRAQIAIVNERNIDCQEVVDEISNTCAGRTNLTLNQSTTFRLLARQNIFELYVDDILVQSYTLGGRSDGRIGFYVRNCSMTLNDLKVYLMDLNESDLA